MTQRFLTEWASRGPQPSGEAEARAQRIAEKLQLFGLKGRGAPRASHRPTFDEKWVEKVREACLADDKVEDLELQRPSWWQPGMPLRRDAVSEMIPFVTPGKPSVKEEQEEPPVMEEVEEEEEEPPVKVAKREYRPVPAEAKEAALSYISLMRERRHWDFATSFRSLQVIAPEIFGHVHIDTPRKWRVSRLSASGRPKKLDDGTLLRIIDIFRKVLTLVPVSSVVLTTIANAELESLKPGLSLGTTSVKTILRSMDYSFKVPLQAKKVMPPDEALRCSENLRLKLAYTMDAHDVTFDRVFNLDQTSCNLLPYSCAKTWGSKKGATPLFVDRSTNVTVCLVTGTQAGTLWAQVIFSGKTTRVLPITPLPAFVTAVQTESHWSSVDTMLTMIEEVDRHVNSDLPGVPWIMIVDCCPVHCAAAFREKMSMQLPHVKLLYVHPGATGTCQPLDISYMRRFKQCLRRVSALSVSKLILAGIDGTELMELLKRSILKADFVHWVSAALQSVRDSNAYHTGWKHLQIQPGDADKAREENVHDRLFWKTKGKVPEVLHEELEPGEPAEEQEFAILGGDADFDEAEDAVEEPLAPPPVELPPLPPPEEDPFAELLGEEPPLPPPEEDPFAELLGEEPPLPPPEEDPLAELLGEEPPLPPPEEGPPAEPEGDAPVEEQVQRTISKFVALRLVYGKRPR
jgi:hypothetical protein